MRSSIFSLCKHRLVVFVCLCCALLHPVHLLLADTARLDQFVPAVLNGPSQIVAGLTSHPVRPTIVSCSPFCLVVSICLCCALSMSGLNCSAIVPLHPGKKPRARAWIHPWKGLRGGEVYLVTGGEAVTEPVYTSEILVSSSSSWTSVENI